MCAWALGVVDDPSCIMECLLSLDGLWWMRWNHRQIRAVVCDLGSLWGHFGATLWSLWVYRRRFARLMHIISPCVRSKRAHKQEIHDLPTLLLVEETENIYRTHSKLHMFMFSMLQNKWIVMIWIGSSHVFATSEFYRSWVSWKRSEMIDNASI